jgi:hypothetical protein
LARLLPFREFLASNLDQEIGLPESIFLVSTSFSRRILGYYLKIGHFLFFRLL